MTEGEYQQLRAVAASEGRLRPPPKVTPTHDFY